VAARLYGGAALRCFTGSLFTPASPLVPVPSSRAAADEPGMPPKFSGLEVEGEQEDAMKLRGEWGTPLGLV